MPALDHALETVTSRSRTRPRRAGAQRLVGHRDAFGEFARLAGDDQRAGRVEDGDVAVGVARAVQHRAQRRGVVRGVAALERGEIGAREADALPA